MVPAFLTESEIRALAALVTALTPVSLAVIGFVQWRMGRRNNKNTTELLSRTERIENMAERNTRTIHGEDVMRSGDDE